MSKNSPGKTSQRAGEIDHWIKMPPKHEGLSLSFPDPYKSQHVALSICHPALLQGDQRERQDSLDACRLASLVDIRLCFH